MKLTANGIDIHYTIEGEGPVVTMSHALGCNLTLWDAQAQALSARYRVLRYDTRGHGQTSAPPGAYSLEQMADDLHGLLTGLGVTATHFLGISMGGMIGQIFALKYPSMVRSVILSSTTSRYPAAARSVWTERIRTIETNGMEPLVEPALDRWFTAPFRERHQDVMDRVRTMIRSTPPQGYIGCCYAIPMIDVTDRLGEIRCPALVIAGENDPGTPVAMAREISSALPSSELTILPSASHLCNLEQAEAFNRALVGFFDEIA